MKNWIKICGMILLSLGMSCEQESTAYKEKANDPELFHKAMQKLSDVIVFDIFSPPVASRVYAYPSIAAYEVMAQFDPRFQSMAGQLRELSSIPPADTTQEMCYQLASLQAFIHVGRALIFSEPQMDTLQMEIHQEFRDMGVPRRVFDRSIAYGELVAKHILDWSGTDNYKETRTFPKFTVTNDSDRWKPTPPAYMDGIEPHWNKIRPFVIDSATQFVPIPPTTFDMSKTSTFYKELLEVYEVGVNLTDEQKEIAAYWDCNPFVMNVVGHVMYATKKITPGGHWIGIIKYATRKAQVDFSEVSETYARTSIALADGFISCWDEKYRSNLVRPETVINEHIDQDWLPYLQTPPFPEYTSGHSVISRAAALALTHIYGDNFAFDDSTEVQYGLPSRSFTSFVHASEEAAISRLYGGIHYMPAIAEGVKQGQKVGTYINQNLVTRVQ